MPSEIIGVQNTWAAYQFDRAVWTAGTRQEQENSKGKGDINKAIKARDFKPLGQSKKPKKVDLAALGFAD